MADQEFLASFAVEIDEAGVTRLQDILEENRKLADRLAASFGEASAAIHALSEDLGLLPDFSGRGVTVEGMAGAGGLSLGLDLSRARKDLDSFTALVKQPVSLKASASGITAAARSAWNEVRDLFSAPLTLRVRAGTAADSGSKPARMSAGGRFARPTEVQVAEDGDAEYIIPVKKESRAVPLLRQLLAELSPAARESLAGGAGAAALSGIPAAGVAPGQITQDNRTVSAPVNIHVTAAGSSPEQIGKSLYDTAERYLLRTLRAASG